MHRTKAGGLERRSHARWEMRGESELVLTAID